MAEARSKRRRSLLTTAVLTGVLAVTISTRAPSQSQAATSDIAWHSSWREVLDAHHGYQKLLRQANESKTLQVIALIETSAYPDMIRALIDVESSWRTRAHSHRDARGLMQIRPIAARQVDPELDPELLYDPVVNVRTGIVIFEEHMEYFMGYDDPLHWALTSYNRGRAGTFALQMAPPSTRYSRKVLNRLENLH